MASKNETEYDNTAPAEAFHVFKAEDIYKKLNSSAAGLSDAEASARLSRYGANALREAKKPGVVARFFAALKEFVIIVLLIAAAVSGVVSVAEGEYSGLVDAGVILLIVMINAAVELIQSGKAENAMEALKKMNKPFAKVVRGGETRRVKCEDIVPGDVVILEAGDIAPADMRLIECASLRMEEAALTGESLPVLKNAAAVADADAQLGDRANMCYASTVAAGGRGRGVVTATGMNTETGKIAAALQSAESTETPLQRQLARTGKQIALIVLFISFVIFGASLIRALVINRNAGAGVPSAVSGALMTSVALAVAAIPEGLPAAVTVTLALAVRRMSERRAVVRRMHAVEALGCCDIICSDKTGTLTLNRMTVTEVFTADDGNFAADGKTRGGAAELAARCGALCNDAGFSDGNFYGDPTETALLSYATRAYGREAFDGYARSDENPFDERKMMSVIVRESDGRETAYVKGAPDAMLSRCAFIYENGAARPMTPADAERISEANRGMAEAGLRVLAAAFKPGASAADAENGMTFAGLLGMTDPLRPEAKEAVAVCKRAGMRVIMITGDHAETARAIAREAGILEDGGAVVTGAELDKMTDGELAAGLDAYAVFARVSPAHKTRIVGAFQAAGKRAAMTGDGVNDAPSLKAADIGVGMGVSGTDVSKAAADIVLADDNFATIAGAVEEGRRVFANIKKSIRYLISSNTAEVLGVFIAVVCLGEEFLTPVMLLWANLVTDTLPALALGCERAESGIMEQTPRKSGEGVFAGGAAAEIAAQGIIQTALVMASFCIARYYLAPGVPAVAMTCGFITLCAAQLFHAYNMRSKKSLLSGNPFDNRFLNFAALTSAAALFLVLFAPGVNTAFFRFASPGELGAVGYAMSLGLAFAVVPLVEVQKIISRAADSRAA